MVPRQAFIPEARETACPFLLGELPDAVQRHRYKKQDVEGGVLSAALKLGNVNTRETSEISKFLLR